MIETELQLFTDKDENTLVGVVNHIVFEAQDTFYKVIVVKIIEADFTWSKSQITVVGNFSEIKEGERYRFIGNLVAHKTYGQQFRVEHYQVDIVTTEDGLITYFASENFPGIGKQTATKLVKKLGTDAISKILADEKILADVGLSRKQTETLLKVLHANNGMEDIIVGLNSFGFSGNMASKVYNFYKEKTLEIINENPYRLAHDIKGIGFSRADQIAKELGFSSNDSRRIEAAIFQTLYMASDQEGHTYLTLEQTVVKAQEYLEKGRNEEIAPNEIANVMIELGNNRKIIIVDNLVYLKRNYQAEVKIAENFYRLVKDTDFSTFSEEKLAKAIRIVEKRLHVTYGVDQVEAIKAAINSPIFLLTGGPGTGKTTIIKGIIEVYRLIHELGSKLTASPIKLAAPTGRAAKRMSEVTEMPASTIHRLLGLGLSDSGPLEEQEVKEIDGTLLIIDETSMVDTQLMEMLVEAIPSGLQVILVGDKNQLPSVGAGQVFSDLLASNVISKIELNKIYRQDDGSTIVNLAHSVQEGQLPADLLVKQADRSFITCQANQVTQVVEQIVKIAVAKGLAKDDIQLLAPMYKGVAGIDVLNELLQDIFNPKVNGKKEVISTTQKFRIGDRVLHLVNKPEDNIFNGDIGKIVGIEKGEKEKQAEELIVDFDGNEVSFTAKDWGDLRLAYCLSIHKSQGSEFPVVILPLVRQFSRMLTRNLLYTAITRAKQKLIMIGEPAAFKLSVETLSLNRQTSLKNHLCEIFGVTVKQVADIGSSEGTITVQEADTLLTPKTNFSEIDPMIGMEQLSPYDFM